MAYICLVTDIGQAKIAAAITGGGAVNIVEGAVGDGGGSPTTPQSSDAGLVNETSARFAVNEISRTGNQVSVNFTVPASDGGYTVREAAVWDEDGDMVLVCSVPAQEKPAGGQTGQFNFNATLTATVQDGDVVQVTIDPLAVNASRAYVRDNAVMRVPDIVALRAMTGVQDEQVADVSGGDVREQWTFDAGDFSDEVDADPDGNYVVAPDTDASGLSGVWRRVGADLDYDRSYSRHSNAVGTGESASLGAVWNYEKLSGAGFISNHTDNMGWAAPATLENWVQVQPPFGVVIGDSIAEGHPGRHGRLHPDANNYDPNYPNLDGQPSYELGRHTNMYWYNHGIGSQSSGQVWDRWPRDVLAEIYDPGDGRGDSTLPRKPYAVVINIGINDIFLGVPLGVLKINMIKMVLSARENGILVGFNTVGPHGAATEQQKAAIRAMRDWALKVIPRYGAYVFDFFSWFESTSTPDSANTDLAIDAVHPSRGGYASWARAFLDETQAPVIMGGLNVSTVGGGAFPSSWGNPSKYKALEPVSGKAVTVQAVNERAVIPPVFDMANVRELRLYVTEMSNLPASGSNRTGISGVSGAFAAPLPSERVNDVAGVLKKDASLGWVLDDTGLATSYGIKSVSAGSSYIEVTFYHDCDRVNVSLWTSSTATLLPSYRATLSNTGSRRKWLINTFDNATGDRVDPTTITAGTLFFEINGKIRPVEA